MNELRIYKCKLCGEPLDITKAANGAIKCGVCDCVNTLPKDTASERLLNFLDNGEFSLDKGDFEGALTAYTKAAELDENEPEAYFGKALAKFKVRYLKDVVNNRLQPICYEITDKKFSDDPDYMSAFMKGTAEQRIIYESRAKEIDYIQSEFYKLKQSGVDYDCFICVKVTDDKGNKTADYKSADDIYFELKGKGYKPFFSERELGKVTGADYEARILYALYSSECMLVVCHDEAYLQTKWVKNEYSRFLKLVNDSEKETDSITIAYGGRPIEKLPGRAGKIQGIDLNKLGALGKVVDFVDSHTPAAKAKRAAEAAAKAKAEEEQKKQFEEQRKALERQQKALEEQQRLFAEQLEKLKNAPAQTSPSAELSDDELFEKMERIRAERERKKREEEERINAGKAEEETARKKEEEERVAREMWEAAKKRQEEELIARERAKAEEERKRKEEEERLARERAEAKAKAEKERIAREKAKAEAERKKKEEAERKKREEEIKSKPWLAPGYPTLESYDKSEFKIAGNKALVKYNGAGGVVKIPIGVTSIGDSAFEKCGISDIIIPDSVTYIGNRAFWYCTDLASLTMPYSVTSIGGGAFRGCENLANITISNGAKAIGNYAFHSCKSLTRVTIPDRVTSIGEEAFGDCAGLESLTIGSGVTSIGGHAFIGCERITIYCRAKEKPDGWGKDWNLTQDNGGLFGKKRAKVVWGYKG